MMEGILRDPPEWPFPVPLEWPFPWPVSWVRVNVRAGWSFREIRGVSGTLGVSLRWVGSI